MKTIDIKDDIKEIVAENLSKNVELYNKLTMLLASIFISALTAIGQHNCQFNIWLKISIILFSISLFTSIVEISLLIIRDATHLDAIPFDYFKKIPLKAYKKAAWLSSFLSLIGFLLGIISINIFILTLQG